MKEDYEEVICGLNATFESLKIDFSRADVKESKRLILIIKKMVIFGA